MAYELLGTIAVAELEVPVEIIGERTRKVSLGGLQVELKKGAKLELPLKAVLSLIRRGEASIDPSRLYSIGELNKIRWKEEQSYQLQKLEPFFYLKARLLIELLEQEAMNEPRAQAKIRHIKVCVLDIARSRLNKILKAVLANPEPSRELMSLMTLEERALYVKLCSIVGAWRDSMQRFIEEGDVLEL